jgi:DNA-binding NarL/FixJ family response regulator
MVIEDSDIVRVVFHNLLAQVRGASVSGEFDTAASAIRALAQSSPDAILLDIQLRAGNGMEVLKVVAAEYPQVKVFVVTNFTDDLYRKRYMEAGAYGFFDKSRDLAALRHSLQTLSAATASIIDDG